MIAIVDQYLNIKKSIAKIIEVSGYRNDYVAKKIGITPSTFAVKKQRHSFSDEEIKDILNVVTMPNEDVENYLLLEEMRRLKDDEEISYNEFKKMSL